MTEQLIEVRLVEKGSELFHAPKGPISFTGEAKADALLNDLETTPHAFVVACIMDRQIKAERAWLIPYRLKQKVGTFDFPVLRQLSNVDIVDLMTKPEPLHRFPNEMSTNFVRALELINNKYGGRASAIWSGQPSSATVVYRFLEFRGAGPKIATMAANILSRDFKVPFSDYCSVDISPDAQVRRVFKRLGLIREEASNEELVYRARAIHPEFPGMLDLPAWEIGREWCRPRAPNCAGCYMREICPTSDSF